MCFLLRIGGSKLSSLVWGPTFCFYIFQVTGQNVDKPKRRQPKRRQTETSTNQNVDRQKRRQTKTSTGQNVDKLKRRQTKTSTHQNDNRPKRRQTETSKPKRRQTKTLTDRDIGTLL